MNNLFRRMIENRYRTPRAWGWMALAIRAILPALAILFLVTGGVSAESSRSIDSWNCQGRPVCDSSGTNMDVGPGLPDCASQPICGYLTAHSGDKMLASQPTLAVALLSQVQPAWYDPQVVMTRTALVHDGPGANYFSYGDLPVGYLAQVIGVSQDQAWMVISLPKTVAPDGMGWIDASFVQTKNLPAGSVSLPGCPANPQCGYILAHTVQSLAVLEPSFFARTFGGPIIAVTSK